MVSTPYGARCCPGAPLTLSACGGEWKPLLVEGQGVRVSSQWDGEVGESKGYGIAPRRSRRHPRRQWS